MSSPTIAPDHNKADKAPAKDPIAMALAALNRLASSKATDNPTLKKITEKAIFHGTKLGFQIAGKLAGSSNKTRDASRYAPGTTTARLDFNYDDEQNMIRDTVRAFANEVLRPAARSADDHAALAPEISAAFAELGLLYYVIPEAFGGSAAEQGVSPLTMAIIAEALAEGDFAEAAGLLAPVSAANAISRHGNADQQKQWLPRFLDEALVGSLVIHEPRIAFDPMQLQCRAEKQANGFILNGEKSSVLRCMDANVFIIAAQLDQAPALFIVAADSEGLQRSADESLGLKAAGLGRLLLQNVAVPADALLAQGDDYQQALQFSRIAWVAMACGTGQSMLDYCVQYANERVAFGEPISHRQAVAFMISNIAIELESMRLLWQKAASDASHGLPYARFAFLAKTLAGDKAMQIGTDGLQILGGHGYTKEHPVERWYRDLRAVAAIEGGLMV